MKPDPEMVEPTAIWRLLHNGWTTSQTAALLHLSVGKVLKAQQAETERLKHVDPKLIANAVIQRRPQPGR